MKYDKLENQSNFHWYKFNDGTKIQRHDLSNIIEKLFENGEELKIPEISQKINMNQDSVTHIIRSLCTKEKLKRQQTNRHTIYSKNIECLLAELYYPKTILDKFKIIGRKVVKSESGKVISYPLSINHQYAQGNTVYEGGK